MKQNGMKSVRRRIVYIQYTNPAAYPPLAHSSGILSEKGWEILFLGTDAPGTETLRFSLRSHVRVRQLRPEHPGWRQKVHYLRFIVWCMLRVVAWRPGWIYCSDLFSCPLAWLFSLAGLKVIYHEHDNPQPERTGMLQRILFRARTKCVQSARLCVVPNARRGERLKQSCPMEKSPAVVWNCPRSYEAVPRRSPMEPGALRLLYHGSIVPERVPLAVIEAIAAVPGRILLTIAGYETMGSRGYIDRLHSKAAELGIAGQVHIAGAVSRDELLSICRTHDAGFALVPPAAADLNLQMMEGASNKAFEYLACGLALIVSRLPEWERMFVAPGYAYCCNPTSAEDIAGVLRKLIDDPVRTRSMGEAGRKKVLAEWNYERQFRPVLDALESGSAEAAIAVRTAPVLSPRA